MRQGRFGPIEHNLQLTFDGCNPFGAREIPRETIDLGRLSAVEFGQLRIRGGARLETQEASLQEATAETREAGSGQQCDRQALHQVDPGLRFISVIQKRTVERAIEVATDRLRTRKDASAMGEHRQLHGRCQRHEPGVEDLRIRPRIDGNLAPDHSLFKCTEAHDLTSERQRIVVELGRLRLRTGHGEPT